MFTYGAQVTSGLTLGFLYYEGGSLITGGYCHGNLCYKPNLLQRRLCSRLEINNYGFRAN